MCWYLRTLNTHSLPVSLSLTHTYTHMQRFRSQLFTTIFLFLLLWNGHLSPLLHSYLPLFPLPSTPLLSSPPISSSYPHLSSIFSSPTSSSPIPSTPSILLSSPIPPLISSSSNLHLSSISSSPISSLPIRSPPLLSYSPIPSLSSPGSAVSCYC